MNGTTFEIENRLLGAGERLTDTELTSLWRIESGALRIDSGTPGRQVDFVCLVLPGDVIGAQVLAGFVERVELKAIVPTTLSVVSKGAHDSNRLLKRTVAQCWSRCCEAVSLRSGSASSRIQRLLLMLASSNQSEAIEPEILNVPNLREIASLVDSTPETVCRVIGLFLEKGMLHERKPMSVRFNSGALREQSVEGLKSNARRYAIV